MAAAVNKANKQEAEKPEIKPAVATISDGGGTTAPATPNGCVIRPENDPQKGQKSKKKTRFDIKDDETEGEGEDDAFLPEGQKPSGGNPAKGKRLVHILSATSVENPGGNRR